MVRRKYIFVIISMVVSLIASAAALFAAPPLPVRIGGAVTVNGTKLTRVADTGYIFKVTKQNGAAYNPVAEDTDGLNNSDWYVVDIPGYDSAEQPGGAQDGETAVVHVYLNGTEQNVTSPVKGEFRVGKSGTLKQIDIMAQTPQPATNNPPSIPTLLYPANGQTGLETTIEFKWGKCSDPEGNTVTYVLRVCEDVNLTTGCIIKENTAYFNNKVFNYAGTGTGLFLFGVVFIGGIKSKKRITLLLAIITFTTMLLISCGGGGGGGNNATPTPTPNPTPASTEVTQSVTGLKTGTTYYWKIVADDGSGGVTESQVQSFTTQ